MRRLHAHLAAGFPYRFRITVADNASTDGTLAVARRVAAELPAVAVVHLAEKGRGRALRAVWSASDAPVLAYMDVDLSTDLAALLPLVAPLLSGHSDLAIGTRLARGSRVVRGAEAGGDLPRLQPASCAARWRPGSPTRSAGSRRSAPTSPPALLPLVEDDGWFFDTELLVLAERSGLRIHEVPVDWVDDPDSRVDIVATALADLRGVARVCRALATGALPLAALRAQLGRAPLDPRYAGGAGRADPAAGAVRRDRRRQHAGLPGAVPAAALGDGRAAGEPAGAAADRGREHRGEPAAHLRRDRVGPAPGGTSCRAWSCSRSGSALTSGVAGRCCTRLSAPSRSGSSSACSSRRTWPRPCCGSCCCGSGCSGPARRVAA